MAIELNKIETVGEPKQSRRGLQLWAGLRAARKLACVNRKGCAKFVRLAGFTLIELMIVITIIFILLGMAAGRYDRSVTRAREASLKQDLMVMRQAIDNYTLDKQSAPESLEALQQAGYLRIIPTDPITQAKDWQPQFDEVVLSPDQAGTGMVDVHSNSDRISTDGTPYKTW
ncbi:MAG: type II secretion system GspH family protein [Acidobacteriota bacterium]|nr:type II secretion system GspH family protein [Acidobacteriota bacterium]